MLRVRLTTEPDGAVALESPYDRAFVDELKTALDWSGRQWDASRKRWIVSALYVTDLLAFLQGQGVQVQDDRASASGEDGREVPPMPDDLREAFDVLFLAYTAPLCVAEGSYKALSKYWHPDHGGDPADFDRVNTAIRIVRRYLDPQDVDEDDDIPF